MGTRHLCMVKNGDKVLVAQYGQWDGYPSGQGTTVVEFLQKLNVQKFKKQLKKVKLLSDEEMSAYYRKCYAELDINPQNGWITMEESNRMKDNHPELHRDTGAEIFELILNNKKDELILEDSSSFLEDGLFCEYVHVIDISTNKYLIYGDDKKTPMFVTSITKPISPKWFKTKCNKNGW